MLEKFAISEYSGKPRAFEEERGIATSDNMGLRWTTRMIESAFIKKYRDNKEKIEKIERKFQKKGFRNLRYYYLDHTAHDAFDMEIDLFVDVDPDFKGEDFATFQAELRSLLGDDVNLIPSDLIPLRLSRTGIFGSK